MTHDTTSHPCPCPTRRQLVGAAAATAAIAPAFLAPSAARAEAVEQPARPEDEGFMGEALDIAKQHGKRYAAVIVGDDAVIAEGYNPGRDAPGGWNPTNHGEMVAIRNCVEEHGAEALQGATLYTTGEPCPMCMGAVVWSRIGRVVYAVPIVRIATLRNQIMVPCTEIAERAPFTEIGITAGVLEEEAWALFE